MFLKLHTDKHTNTQTDRQANRQTDKQTHLYCNTLHMGSPPLIPWLLCSHSTRYQGTLGTRVPVPGWIFLFIIGKSYLIRLRSDSARLMFPRAAPAAPAKGCSSKNAKKKSKNAKKHVFKFY